MSAPAPSPATAPSPARAGQSPAPLASLCGVGVRYGRKQALAGVGLDVEPGGFVAVIGPDGAGKSTLLRVLAGLRRASQGEVVRTVSKEELGFSGSDFDLYGDLTVMENLRFFAAMRGLSNAEFRQAADRMLETVGLTEAADRLADHLSGGMKKKLGLAAALIYQPKLLLLDEPTVGVDPASRRELWSIVAQACAAGTAVVFSTTYLDEAERARRVVFLSGGEAVELPPDHMKSLAEGWQAWLLAMEPPHKHLRLALARAQLDARVYARPEGLVVLATTRGEAEESAAKVVSFLGGGSGAVAPVAVPRLEPAPLSLDDLFVLVQMGLAGRKAGVA